MLEIRRVLNIFVFFIEFVIQYLQMLLMIFDSLLTLNPLQLKVLIDIYHIIVALLFDLSSYH